MPRSSRCRFWKLLMNRLAPESRTTLTAICATTRNPRIRVCAPEFAVRAERAIERGLSRAGTTPHIAAHTSASRTAKPIIRRSGCASARNGTPDGEIEIKTRNKISASTHPAAAPATANSSASTSTCRMIRNRVAPSAERTASSRSLAAPRAENRLATLAHAISITASAAPSNTHAAR